MALPTPVLPGDLCYPLDDVLIGGTDHLVSTRVQEFLDLLTASYNINRFDSKKLRELEHQAPNRRICRGLHEPFASFDLQFLGEHDPC